MSTRSIMAHWWDQGVVVRVATKRPRLSYYDQQPLKWSPTVPPCFALPGLAAAVCAFLQEADLGRARCLCWSSNRVWGYDACWDHLAAFKEAGRTAWGLPPGMPTMTLVAYGKAHALNLRPSLVERVDHVRASILAAERKLAYFDRKTGDCHAEWLYRRARVQDVADDLFADEECILADVRPLTLRLTEHCARIRTMAHRLAALHTRRHQWQQRLSGLLQALLALNAKAKKMAVFRLFPPMRSSWDFYDTLWGSAGEDEEDAADDDDADDDDAVPPAMHPGLNVPPMQVWRPDVAAAMAPLPEVAAPPEV